MDTVDKVLSKGHLVQMYIQKVRTQKPILWTAERRISRASCPWRFVCNTFWSFSFHTVSSCLTIFPMASSDQLQLFIPQPLSNMDDKSCTCMMSQPSFESAVVFEVWSSTYLISNWEHFHHGLCAAFSPSSLESELELGEGCKPVTTAIQKQ